jgi:peptidoglycan/xylan/chitin deacetylase (PgdA/CDA1 family)
MFHRKAVTVFATATGCKARARPRPTLRAAGQALAAVLLLTGLAACGSSGGALKAQQVQTGPSAKAPAVASRPRPTPTLNALHLPPRSGIRTVVTLTFDDGVYDQYKLYDLLPPRHLTATLYVNSGLLYETGYANKLALTDLDDLVAHGVEIGGHSVDHPDLTHLSESQLRHEICDDRAQLRAWGYEAVSFAYPSSRSDAQTEAIAHSCGYPSARVVGGVSCPECPAAESDPPLDPYSLRTADAVESTTTLAQMQQQVLDAEAQATVTGLPAWLIMNFHHICDRCNRYSVTERNLAALLDWLAHRPASTAVRSVGAVILHGFK